MRLNSLQLPKNYAYFLNTSAVNTLLSSPSPSVRPMIKKELHSQSPYPTLRVQPLYWYPHREYCIIS